jgi:tRNA pseudouridine32 synthase/23S rRNA pseudouridine746 synthase
VGLLIEADPLYPNIIDVSADNFSMPLQLLAHSIEFVDPLTGAPRRFVS